MKPAAPRIWRAPGKLILLGEYAVLDGAPALVVAVDRDVRCTVEPAEAVRVDAGSHGVIDWPADRGSDRLPLIRALLARRAAPGCYRLDSDALYAETEAGRRKLGLGSSAATTVALAAALGGDPFPDPADVFQLAQAVHRAVQGTGSGADIAASSFGGALAYRWLDDPAKAPLDALPAGDGAGHVEALPAEGSVWAVWSGDSASTVELVGRVGDWAARDPAGHRARVTELGFAARAGIDAWRAGDRAGLAAAAEAGRRAIDGLGRDAGVALCTEAHRALHTIARQSSGAGVKPTGAGGGDLAWIYAAQPTAEAAAAKALAAAGHRVFRFAIADGVEALG